MAKSMMLDVPGDKRFMLDPSTKSLMVITISTPLMVMKKFISLR